MNHLHDSALKAFYEDSPYREAVLAWYPFREGEEYITLFDPEELSVEILRRYRQKLSDEGKLLIAFENPFGLQYFAGKTNDYTKKPFTFRAGTGKAELELMLDQAGFHHQKWYYPFPNHYFTKEVYSDNYLPNEFMNHRSSDFLEEDACKLFDENELWREIIRGGAFRFLCNAYLVEAGVSDGVCDVDYAAITIYRERDRAFATTIHSNRMVKKTALYPEGVERLIRMQQSHEDMVKKGIKCVRLSFEGRRSMQMPFFDLPTLWDYWTGRLLSGSLEKELLFSHWDYIRDAIYRAADEGRVYWELGPANALYDEATGDIIFFDQEFYWENIEPDVALVRGLWLMMWTDGSSQFAITKVWLEELKKRYGLAERWDELLKIARDATHEYVFNPDANRPLEVAAQRARRRIEVNQRRMKEWARTG